MTVWHATAPSNIALIKYMGRKDEVAKIPDNASLSYTLPDLKSFVELERLPEGSTSRWEPLLSESCSALTLSESGQERFLAHLRFIQEELGDHAGAFLVRSGNNFPQATGLASSASSFAALTLAAVQAICAITEQSEPSVNKIADLSRRGSGSSCRSLYEPWALWDNETVEVFETAPLYQQLIHDTIIISAEEKAVSSSKAHQNVKTSPLYIGRPERAQNRLKHFMNALKDEQAEHWQILCQIAWEEFQDMHRLFETAIPAFSYRSEATQQALNALEQFWQKNGDGPIVTMDAGPNIHLLYRSDQKAMQDTIRQAIQSSTHAA